jgi:hypothetical protein
MNVKVFGFGLAAACVSLAASGPPAHATYRLFSAMACTGSGMNSLMYANDGQASNCGANSVWLQCPVDVGSSFNPLTSATITLYGWGYTPANNLDKVATQACRVYAGGGGGTCGSGVQSGNSGATFAIQPNAAAWSQASQTTDARLLVVFLPGVSSSGSCDGIWSYSVTY